MKTTERVLVVFAALAGLLGVLAAATAAHLTGQGNLTIVAQFLLFHAPVLLGLTALIAQGSVSIRLGRLAGFVLLLGLSLFCGDLSRRALANEVLFPMAAPTGGVLLMIGWVLSGLSAVIAKRS